MKREDDPKNIKPGSGPLDMETVWGVPEKELPKESPFTQKTQKMIDDLREKGKALKNLIGKIKKQ